MKKMYCLVVTDEFSRFSWVFFLATKDETSEILKSFITEIENLINLRVKVIICDNGIEFKNRVMNEFCEMKGIKREFSVARTPQQNGAEVVNTACYVQNRVLVIKPHNKTPYELFLGSGPTWLFDIDGLTKTMNYQPVVVGNQTNGNAGDAEKKDNDDPREESRNDDQEKEDDVNNTNTVNAASTNEVNAGGAKPSIELPDDPDMPPLEEIVYSDDDEDVGAKADMTNLDTHILFSPIPTTRIHKDHPVDQIIIDIHSTPQTRRMTKSMTEHVMVSTMHQRINHKDFQNCLFACFLSQAEPKKNEENKRIKVVYMEFYKDGGFRRFGQRYEIKIHLEDLVKDMKVKIRKILFPNTISFPLVVKKVNKDAQIHALIDGKKVVVSEATIRSVLHLAIEGGVECLPTATIFEEIARIGYEKSSQKLTFYKALFSMLRNLDPKAVKFLMYLRRDTEVSQPSEPNMVADEDVLIERVTKQSNDPLSGSQRVHNLAMSSLENSVYDLVAMQRSSDQTAITPNPPSWSVANASQVFTRAKDASKQGRKIDDIDKDTDITLVHGA
ncbi:putative ribonuclease H-like domain-containing protein [Tanacetum coccineum]